jgi:hypothetical protein
MGIFDRRRTPPEAPPPYQPTVDMRTARPAVFALAYAMASNDTQVRAAIANLARLSGRPPLEQRDSMIQNEPGVLQRPWVWLAAVMRQAGDIDDYHLAAAALLWAVHWTAILVPRIGQDAAAFAELELDPIPPALKTEIRDLGIASARRLPPEFVIAGDDSGQVHAGQLAETAGTLLAP